MAIPFVPPLEVRYGEAEQVSPLIRRVVAENPSMFTYRGTGTYIIGRGEVAVVDPGPELESHQAALAAALEGERVTHILVTHCHADHSPLARWLAGETGATTFAYGPQGAIDPSDDVATEEAVDTAFDPDVRLAHGEVVEGAGWTVEAVHTPGHTSNHTAYALAEERALFTGDHVMGWSTTVIAPPDGDMRAYFASLRLLLGRDDAVLWPTHGGPVTDPPPSWRPTSRTAWSGRRRWLPPSAAAPAACPPSSPSTTPPCRRSCTLPPSAASSPTS